MPEEVITLEPQLTEKATIKCSCLGANAKKIIVTHLDQAADRIEQYSRETAFPEMREPALGYTKMIRELIELIKKIPECK